MAIQFKPKLAPSIATLIVLPILMSLGFWQVDRAEFKRQKMDEYTARSEQEALKLKATDSPDLIKTADAMYQKFVVSGQYDAQHSFLIDNRVHQSQIGFYVVTPFRLGQSNNMILVNRGWIKGKRYRSELPEFKTTTKKISIKGTGYIPSKNFFAMGNVKINPQQFPAVIQNIDFPAISSVLKMKVYPFILRLEPGDKSGFVREWKVITSSPEKSESYAAQWFTMGLVVLLLFLRSCFKSNQEKTA